MPDLLHRLFTFAKADSSRPLENFTTEALAAAIRADAKPLLTVLARVADSPVDKQTVQSVATQVEVRGGVVDLEIVLSSGVVYWIEVKAHAGLHGDQMKKYQEAAALDHRIPKLAMLCKLPLGWTGPTMRWNHLRDAMATSSHPRWLDLKHFIEKYAMADEFDDPISLADLIASRTTRALFGKATRLAREIFELSAIANAIDFPKSDSNIATVIAQQFQRHGRFVLASKSRPSFFFGLLPKDGSAQLAVWVEFRPTDFEGRDAVFAVADVKGGLDESWARRREGWPNLMATMNIDGTLEQEVALAWLCERFADLERSGVVKAVGSRREVVAESSGG